MTDEHAHGEQETDAIADAQQAPSNEPPWAELRKLDCVFLGMVVGGGIVFLLFFFKVL